MPYKCSKCGKEFLLKSRFRGHLRRKSSCTTQSSLDAFKKLLDVTADRLETTDPANMNRQYFENRMNDLELFYKNLTETEQKEAKTLYEEGLKDLIHQGLLRTQTGQMPGL
jgi:hypothetical protein